MAQPLQPSSQAMQSTQNTGFLQPNGACCAHCRHNQTSAVASIRSESETVHPDAPGNSQWNHHDFSPASWKERFAMRIHHFTFAWFASTMSTGGLAVTINAMPLYFGTAQYVLGVTVFIIDLIIFSTLTVLMLTRFVMYPSTIKNSWLHPHESMFIPCFFLSIASIILGINSFAPSHAGPWITVLTRVLFWIYLSVTFPVSVLLYITQFFKARESIDSMTPTWVLGIFATMLSGTIASQVAGSQTSENGVPIIIAGIMIQGLGFWVFLAIMGVFFQKIFTSKHFPDPSARFGFYMFVGGPGYTTLALVASGRAASIDGVFYMDFILGTPGAANIARVWADLFGAFFWGFTAWLCLFATIAVLIGTFAGGKPGSQMTFSLSWFAFVFPNVGFTIGTMLLAEEFGSHALKVVTAVMTVILAIGLILLWFAALRAVWLGYIMMPGKDEDKAIAAFKGEFDRYEERYPREALYKLDKLA